MMRLFRNLPNESIDVVVQLLELLSNNSDKPKAK